MGIRPWEFPNLTPQDLADLVDAHNWMHNKQAGKMTRNQRQSAIDDVFKRLKAKEH